MVLDYLDKFYSSFRNLNKVHSLFRFLTREFVNLFMPIYFKINKIDYQLNKRDVIIVSFTTFPARIGKIWLVIECMLRQTLLPSKILIWLSKEQFPNLEKDLPHNLDFYIRKGLIDIRFVDEDIRSHKKYFYVFQEFPNDIIVTIDDDLYYPSNILKDLMGLHKLYPDTVCCLRGYQVRKVNKELTPYNKWSMLYNEYGPGYDIFHTSGGGTLYKRSFFSDEVLNKQVFKEICFYADDVWLNMMLQVNGTKSVKGEFYSHILPVKNQSFKLSKGNVYEGGNDKQIQAVKEYYQLDEAKLFS